MKGNIDLPHLANPIPILFKLKVLLSFIAHRMLNNVLIRVGLMNKRTRIGFWGPNIDEGAVSFKAANFEEETFVYICLFLTLHLKQALVHALQTATKIHPYYPSTPSTPSHKYPKASSLFYTADSEEFTIGNVAIAAGIPSGHESSHREWREHLPRCDGIVYIVGAGAFDEFELGCAKRELEGLLMDDALSNPLLILVPKDGPVAELRRELGIEEMISKGKRKVALFTYSVSSTYVEGAEEGQYQPTDDQFIVGY
ncbi:GTP-binding protein SAR2 [Hypsizygus marmoreus]|uniref:GTP-binding protein SAR2 n=1 Tax=Hypsizygus marmoreus TaxID=39966 RepID=A0A369K7I1_HYPMA|nr:GTP-binding protein SAR2 [Hypsizygus marmoreus]